MQECSHTYAFLLKKTCVCMIKGDNVWMRDFLPFFLSIEIQIYITYLSFFSPCCMKGFDSCLNLFLFSRVFFSVIPYIFHQNLILAIRISTDFVFCTYTHIYNSLQPQKREGKEKLERKERKNFVFVSTLVESDTIQMCRERDSRKGK